MEDNKSFFGVQKILIALLVLSTTTIMFIKSRSSEAQSTENINVNNIPAKVGAQQQMEELKEIDAENLAATSTNKGSFL